jgi:hypothetical protein
MLHQISWPLWWAAMFILTGGYYLAIYFFLVGKKGFPRFKKAAVLNSPASSSPSSPEFEEPEQDSEEQMVYRCVDELTAFYAEAKAQMWGKAELLTSLGRLLSHYPGLTTSTYKDSLLHVIVTEAQNVCSLPLTKEEVEQVCKKGE